MVLRHGHSPKFESSKRIEEFYLTLQVFITRKESNIKAENSSGKEKLQPSLESLLYI